jgi:hypothetical protein
VTPGRMEMFDIDDTFCVAHGISVGKDGGRPF